MPIKILGSGQEVGRTSLLVDAGKEKFLLDHGVNVDNMDFPIEPNAPVDAICLSHAHLDHSGHIPCMYRTGFGKSIYATKATFDLCTLILRDSLKVQKKKGILPHYGLHELLLMKKFETAAEYGKPISIGSSQLTMFDAGHTPGSASTLIESNGKRILYTGDIRHSGTLITNPAYTDFKNIDVLITEATYTYKDHPDREKLAEELRGNVEETIANNGIALLPSFAIGRAQEMLLIVSGLGLPVVMDGMAVSATVIALGNKPSIKNWEKLWEAFKRARKIKKPEERREVLKKPCVIISGAGMLNGGPISYYIRRLHDRPDCRLVLSGFQIPGTVGRTLTDTGRYINEDLDVEPKMQVDVMDFSSHCGRTELINFIKKLNPGKTILVHTDHGPEFEKELKGMGFDAVAPRNGDVIKVC